jgi:hypothetical protein
MDMSIRTKYSPSKNFPISRSLWPLPQWSKSSIPTTRPTIHFDHLAKTNPNTQSSTVTMDLEWISKESFESNSVYQEALCWAKQSSTKVFYIVIWNTLNGTKLKVGRFDYKRIPMRSERSMNHFIEAIVEMWLDIRETIIQFSERQRSSNISILGQISAFKSNYKSTEAMDLLNSASKILVEWMKLCRLDIHSIIIPSHSHLVERQIVKHILKNMYSKLGDDQPLVEYGVKRSHSSCGLEEEEDHSMGTLANNKKRYYKMYS